MEVKGIIKAVSIELTVDEASNLRELCGNLSYSDVASISKFSTLLYDNLTKVLQV